MDTQQPMQVDGAISDTDNMRINNNDNDENSIIQNWDNVRINAIFRE